MKTKHDVPSQFLLQEIREGYTVSSEMKKVWAGELDLFQELFRVCKKHNLRIWADSGTLLGAVRHKGFIPWDDDIDLLMPREDYDKLLSVASKEFEHPYFLQTMHNDPYYTNRHAQLRNDNTMARGAKQTRYKYNSGIFIDIFPLDYMPASPRAFKNHYKEISGLKAYMKFVRKLLFKLPKSIYLFLRNNVRWLSDDALLEIYERKLRSVDSSKSVSWAPMAFNHASPQLPVFCFSETELVDFEYLKMPIPKYYDVILRAKYGDYMTPVQAPTFHNGLVYDTDNSYRDMLKKG